MKGNNWWNEINWSALKKIVEFFQERIAIASKNGVNHLCVKLMGKLVSSESAKLLAIYSVTQKAKGRYARGIDTEIYSTPEKRMELSYENFNYKTYSFSPVLIREIPKKSRASTF